MSYPSSQLIVNVFSKPYLCDRAAKGDSILVDVKGDIPPKLLKHLTFPKLPNETNNWAKLA